MRSRNGKGEASATPRTTVGVAIGSAKPDLSVIDVGFSSLELLGGILLMSRACFAGVSDCRWPQTLEQKPKTRSYFEKGHGRIEPPQVHYLGEAWEDDE